MLKYFLLSITTDVPVPDKSLSLAVFPAPSFAVVIWLLFNPLIYSGLATRAPSWLLLK
jgi:hypothetical protein